MVKSLASSLACFVFIFKHKSSPIDLKVKHVGRCFAGLGLEGSAFCRIEPFLSGKIVSEEH